METTENNFEKTRIRTFGFGLLVLLASFGSTLLIIELILRVFGLGFGIAPLERHAVLHHVHPREYQFQSYKPDGEYGGFSVHYDSNGLRVSGKKVGKPNLLNRPNIIFLGDSFVEATQVEFEQSFVALFQREFAEQVDVFNFGVGSYSPLLSRLQLTTLLEQIEPNVVIHLLFGNDVSDDKDYYEQATFDDQRRPIAVDGGRSNRLKRVLRRSYIARLVRRGQLTLSGYFERDGAQSLMIDGQQRSLMVDGQYRLDAELSELTRLQLEAINRTLLARGNRYVLMCVPSILRFNFGIDHENLLCGDLKEFALEHSIDYVDLRPEFERSELGNPFFETDLHFNETGHRLVFEALLQAAPEIGVLRR